MEQPATLSSAARRNEDIALDLLKFVATTTHIGRPGTASTGFTAPHNAKADDQVTHLLELYTRCLEVVQGKSGAQ
jgi:hypothetical protein